MDAISMRRFDIVLDTGRLMGDRCGIGVRKVVAQVVTDLALLPVDLQVDTPGAAAEDRPDAGAVHLLESREARFEVAAVGVAWAGCE